MPFIEDSQGWNKGTVGDYQEDRSWRPLKAGLPFRSEAVYEDLSEEHDEKKVAVCMKCAGTPVSGQCLEWMS